MVEKATNRGENFFKSLDHLNKTELNSTSSQTLAMGENDESSVDPLLKHIKNQKLMFGSEIEPCIEFVVSGIESGEDTETLEETLSEI